MLAVLQDNVLWLIYGLFIVLMLRMHLGHGGRGCGGGHAHQENRSPASPDASPDPSTVPPETRQIDEQRHAH